MPSSTAAPSSSTAAKLPPTSKDLKERAPRAGSSKGVPGRRSSKFNLKDAAARAAGDEAGGDGTSKDGAGWSTFIKSYKDRGNLGMMRESLTFDALFKRYELAKAFSLDTDQVRRDAKRVKKRLVEANRCLIDTESRTMQIWDLGTILALIFTLIVTPYEIGYLDGMTGTGAMALQYTNHTVSLIFGIDMLLNFFRPYRDLLGQKVKSHRLIAFAYVRSWLIVDLMSTVPFDTIADILWTGEDASTSPTLKMVRLLRLLKLFRIVRASRVFARWADRLEHYISISHSTRSLLTWTMILLTVVHWFICCWGLVAQLQGSQRDSELTALVAADDECSTSGACLPTDPSNAPQCVHPCLTSCELRLKADLMGWSSQLAFNQENWVCRAETLGTVMPTAPMSRNSKELARMYRYASIAHIFGQLGPTNLVEYVVAYILAFCWLMMQNAFIGILCGTIADGDRHAKEYKQRMDEVNYFLRDMNAPRDLAVRAREHCRSTRGLHKKAAYVKLFEGMSPMLRGDLAQLMSLRTLENVWYFQSCEAELLRALSEKLQPIGFARGERIYFEPRINIVAKGAAARGGKILTLDCYWGEDMIITSDALKDTRYASALTYLELTTVSRADLEECLVRFPKSERVIRVTALKMAMQRAGQIIAHHLQTRPKAKQLSNALTAQGQDKTQADKSADEGLLREMMIMVNGGKKLRAFDSKVGQIVDENETVIDDDYVRAVQEQQRKSTDERLLKLQEDISEMRIDQQRSLDAERAHIAQERAAITAEREMFTNLLGGRMKPIGGEPARHGLGHKLVPVARKPRPASRAETATPASGRVHSLTNAAREAAAAVGVQYEKRYRRRRKDGSPSPARDNAPRRPGAPSPADPDKDLSA